MSSRGLRLSSLKGLMERRRGFTLIELTLVSVIIVILINISVPLFKNTLQNLRLDNTCHDVHQLIKYLQTRSIVESVRYSLQFDFQKGLYWAEVERREGLDVQDFEPLKDVIGRTNRVSSGIYLDGEESRILFYPDGRIDDARIVFTDSSGLAYSLIITNSNVTIRKLNEE